MTVGLILGAALFVGVAILSEKNALWLPVIVLLVAAAANAFKEVM